MIMKKVIFVFCCVLVLYTPAIAQEKAPEGDFDVTVNLRFDGVSAKEVPDIVAKMLKYNASDVAIRVNKGIGGQSITGGSTLSIPSPESGAQLLYVDPPSLELRSVPN